MTTLALQIQSAPILGEYPSGEDLEDFVGKRRMISPRLMKNVKYLTYRVMQV